MSGCHGGRTDDGVIAHCRDCFQRHVSGALDGPFIVLFAQDGADEPCDGCFAGDDADDLCPAFDLAVEAFERIGAVELHPVLGGEAHVGQH